MFAFDVRKRAGTGSRACSLVVVVVEARTNLHTTPRRSIDAKTTTVILAETEPTPSSSSLKQRHISAHHHIFVSRSHIRMTSPSYLQSIFIPIISFHILVSDYLYALQYKRNAVVTRVNVYVNANTLILA